MRNEKHFQKLNLNEKNMLRGRTRWNEKKRRKMRYERHRQYENKTEREKRPVRKGKRGVARGGGWSKGC